MNKQSIVILLPIFLVLGCTSVTPSPSSSPTLTPKVLEATETLQLSPTATAKPDFYTPFGETGSIWIFPNRDDDLYLLLDLETQQIRQVDGPEEKCNVPRNETGLIYCEGSKGELFVFDLFSGERLTAIRDNSIRSWMTNNGQFLYYEYFDETTFLYTIASYSMIMDNSKVLFQQSEQEYEERRWQYWQFSEDGERIIVLQQGEGVANITGITGYNLSYEIIEESNQIEVSLLALSPSGKALIYAVQPSLPGIHPSFPDRFYIIDLEEGETRLLTQAIDFTYWLYPPVYSPDESQIILTRGRNEFCIVIVESGSQICRKVLPENYNYSTFEWSPSGKSIAFVGENRNSPYDANLYIYSLDEDRTVLLLTGIENYPNARSTIWIP